MSKHVHADAMAQYAQEAQASDTPWRHWETRVLGGDWHPLRGHPDWVATNEYRRIRVWPTPYRDAWDAEAAGEYWSFDRSREDEMVTKYTWDGDYGDYYALDRGLAFRSEADADMALDIISNLEPGTRL